MAEKHYKLITDWGQAYAKDRLYYAMDDSDLTAIAENDKKIDFGTKVYVLKTHKTYIFGDDGQWYSM